MLLFAMRMCVYECVCYHVYMHMRVGLFVYIILSIVRDYIFFIIKCIIFINFLKYVFYVHS
jgi:hypothetical protein